MFPLFMKITSQAHGCRMGGGGGGGCYIEFSINIVHFKMVVYPSAFAQGMFYLS